MHSVSTTGPSIGGGSGSRRIRLVHCIPAMSVGGAELQLAELITRLPPERFEQLLVLVNGGGQLLGRVRAAGCRVVELGYGLAGGGLQVRRRLALVRVLRQYRRELGAFRPDIVHAQLFWSNLLSVAAGRMAGVPTIITSRLALSRREREPRWMQHARNLANHWTTAIFVNSEAVRRDVLAHERVRPEVLTLIPNGVVVGHFATASPDSLRREFALKDADIVLTTIANLHPVKGHDDLLRALVILKERHPNVRLLLPGRDRGVRAKLEALIPELGLEQHVRLLGERSDIPQLLALADVVVHPSHEEGFSNAVLEAMACGRPMVVTNVGGNPEAVRNGLDGFLVPPRDPSALATAIDRLVSDRDLRRRMGESARRRIEAEFSMDRMIARFVAWYQALSSARAPGVRAAPSQSAA